MDRSRAQRLPIPSARRGDGGGGRVQGTPAPSDQGKQRPEEEASARLLIRRVNERTNTTLFVVWISRLLASLV